MAISIADVEYIPLQDACKRIPGRPHVNTVRRWCDRGFNGVILQSWRCGNRILTSIPAIDAFIQATTGIHHPGPRITSNAHKWAEAKLDAEGVK